jgi:phage shock protein A
MSHENENTEPVEQKAENKEYEAPAIESVMTPQDLDREVQYAGAPDGTVAIG